jgi:Flp pilus assembly pilin Flp
MNASEVPGLIGALLLAIVGVLLVILHQPFSKRVKMKRERLGVHVGPESHPTMLLFVGLLFVAISVVILIGTSTDAFSGSPRV